MTGGSEVHELRDSIMCTHMMDLHLLFRLTSVAFLDRMEKALCRSTTYGMEIGAVKSGHRRGKD